MTENVKTRLQLKVLFTSPLDWVDLCSSLYNIFWNQNDDITLSNLHRFFKHTFHRRILRKGTWLSQTFTGNSNFNH